ncbi:hypothetical protein HC928_04505 [bacterium]|nr:hypothetical protein [bacterium]
MQQFKQMSIFIGLVAIAVAVAITPNLTAVLAAVIASSCLFMFAVDTSGNPAYNRLLIGYTAVLVFGATTLVAAAQLGLEPILSTGLALVNVFAIAAVGFLAHTWWLNSKLFVPAHTRVTIVGPYGKRQHYGPTRIHPASPLLKETLAFAIKETQHRCDITLTNINTYHPQRYSAAHGTVTGWRTGPPSLGYDLSEASIHAIDCDVTYTPLPSAAFDRFKIAGYDGFRKQAFATGGVGQPPNIGELADRCRHAFDLAIQEKLDEIVRELLIVRHNVTPADVRNMPQLYAGIAQAKLAAWAQECGLQIEAVEFRSVQLVDPAVEQQYRHTQVAAYSKAQEIQLLNAALANSVAVMIEQTIGQLEAQGVPITKQMVATITQDAMREAFLMHQRQRVQLTNTAYRPANVTPLEPDPVVPFRKAS